MTAPRHWLRSGWSAGLSAFLLLVSWITYPPIFNVVFVVVVMRSVAAFMRFAGVRPRRTISFFIIASLSLLYLSFRYAGLQIAPYLAVVAINLILAFMFASGLRRNRRPLLVQFVELDNKAPDVVPEFHAFLRNQCIVWVIIGLTASSVATGAMVWPPMRPWANGFLTILLIVQVIWFILSHKLAARRFARPESWKGTLLRLSEPATWQRLEV